MFLLKSLKRFPKAHVFLLASLCTQVAPAQYSPSTGVGQQGMPSNTGSQSGTGSAPMDFPVAIPGLPRGTSSGPIVLPGNQRYPQGTVMGGQFAQQQRRRPTSKLTDFQQLVASSIRTVLPIFGQSLFDDVPSTFAPVDNIPVTPDYVIGPGDELLVQAWGQVTLDSHYTVDRTGNIYIPQVGSVHVAGLPYAKVTDAIRSQMAKDFKNFDLNVNMGQLRSIQVFVVGQASRPGSYTISSLSTLVNALFATGGPAPEGSLRDIQLKRDGKVVVHFDMYDLLLKGDKSKDVQLLPGDVIYIPPAGQMVAIAGSVNNPAIYELKAGGAGAKADNTVQRALQLAGGLSNTASTQVHIERVSNHRDLSVLDVKLPAGNAAELRNGDIVEVWSIVDRFTNAVTLRGNVTNPGRYAWHPGMRIRDLIPNKEALLTRNYWARHNLLGNYNLQYSPFNRVMPVRPNAGGNAYGVAPGTQQGQSGAGQSGAGQAGAGQAVGQSGDPYAQQSVDGAGQPGAAGTTAGANGIPPETAGAAAIPSYGQQRTASGASRDATSEGRSRSTLAAAATGSSGSFPAVNQVELVAPDIDWKYAVIERQSPKDLSTSLIPFDLGGAVLQGDEKDNLELKPGDVVTVFSTADIRVPQSQRTRYVRLEGEFVASGIYSVLPGETLRQLVIRAGGLTSHAYLYGADFTRESQRRLQQQRLDEYADQLGMDVSAGSIKASTGAVSAADAAAAQAGATNGAALVARLRLVRATGRIVLESRPDSRGADSLPDLPLEDGDTFVVPIVPSSVNVEGAVYSPNAFLYDPHRRVGDYLHLAGGGTRDADKDRSFVLRADGSVVSNQFHSPLRSGFDSIRLYPGDTIVVPQNLRNGSTMRFVLNISQIVGQFGLGLAAVAFLL